MKSKFYFFLIIALSLVPLVTAEAQTALKVSEIPNEWIDASTGYKVIRLTRRDGDNQSFYFHNNPFLKSFSSNDDLMVFYGSTDRGKQLFTIDLSTLKINQITNTATTPNGEIVAPKHREVIYQCGDSVFASHVDSRKTRLLYVFTNNEKGSVTSLNADETLLAGSYSDGQRKHEILKQYPEKRDFFKRIFEAHVPHSLFTIDLKTKKLKVILKENEWINHIQFSPVDSQLLMYCHEGPWEKVNRIWIINVQTGKNQLMHKRTVENEIAGHEFWAPDGKTIWFDLQIPKSVTFYLAGVNLETGKETRYQHQRDEWSIHYNITPDLKIFCGDGGDSTQVAKAKDGRWIYLFSPDGDKFKSERLVNMKNHVYRLEPNVHFSPEGKWVIFRSNMFGKTNVFAVERSKGN